MTASHPDTRPVAVDFYRAIRRSPAGMNRGV